MLSRLIIGILCCVCGACLLASCSSGTNDDERVPDSRVSSTYEDFVNRRDYQDTRDVWYHDARISVANTANSRILVLLNVQRGILFVNDKVAMDFPVCTGRSTYETPRGKFRIIEKVEEYRSKSYGNIYNSDDVRVISGATPSTPVPKGCYYKGAAMPYWMRIKGGYGFHVGKVLRTADSHGCIRVPVEPCSILFEKCGVGTRVEIRN